MPGQGYLPDPSYITAKPFSMEFINLTAQYQAYKEEIDTRMRRVIERGAFIMGPEVIELENALASYVGVKHCITVANGTVSLEIALRALEIGADDEVITVPFTWISTAEVIRLVGAKPVFVDIDLSNYTININQIEAAINTRTRAIIPVSLFGQMPDYKRINEIATRYQLAVIEDGAQSFGAMQHGCRSCGVSLVGSTSFFPAKPLGCYGDGGALFTDDDTLAEKMRAIRTHGSLKRHQHPFLGMNARFDTLQAAVLLAKLPHLDAELRARARIGAQYNDELRAICAVSDVIPGNTHVYAQFTIRIPNREAVGLKLKERGIPTGVYYPKCLHEQPVFHNCGYRWGDFPFAEQASREVLSLPMHPFLSDSEQDKIVGAVKEALVGPNAYLNSASCLKGGTKAR